MSVPATTTTCIPPYQPQLTPSSIEPEKPKAQCRPRVKRRPRRLTFAPRASRHVVHAGLSLEDYTPQEIHDTWWSPEEKRENRMRAKPIVISVRKRRPNLVSLIDEAFKTAQEIASSLQDSPTTKSFPNASEYSSNLKAWTGQCFGYRGLEKCISAYHRDTRPAIAREARAMVLETQRVGVCKDEMGLIYGEESRASQFYARMMGEADYHAALMANEDVVPPHTTSLVSE